MCRRYTAESCGSSEYICIVRKLSENADRQGCPATTASDLCVCCGLTCCLIIVDQVSEMASYLQKIYLRGIIEDN